MGGFGLRYARSDQGLRLAVLLVIAALASLILWLVGLHGRTHGWPRRLQANTERRRPVLSTVFVGRQLIRRRQAQLSGPDFSVALAELRAMIESVLPV